MAVSSKPSETLGTYGDAASFPLVTYAKDEVVAEAYGSVVSFR